MSHPSNNVVLLRGRLSSDPRPKQMPSGDEMISYEVTTDLPDGRASVPVVWFSPRRPPAVGEGDEVVVVGFVRRRFFRFAGGASSRTEVVADTVARPTTRAATRAIEHVRDQVVSGVERGEEAGEVVHH